MKRIYMACHLKAPVGLWGCVHAGGIRFFRDGARFVFTHATERNR